MYNSVLIVDDEPGILYSLKAALETDDTAVVTAPTAALGIAAVAKEKPDAVILDVRLPDLSGLDAFDRIRALGIADIESRIRFEKVVTPKDWRDEFAVGHGATFNLAHDLRQMLFFRPGNRFNGTEGLYLVGGGTHPGSGLPVIYEGARISTGLLLRDLGLAPVPTRI